MLENYLNQFGNRLRTFEEVEIPRVLDSLPDEDRLRVTAGKGEFPKDLVEAIRDSSGELEDRVHSILVISGTWMNATTGSHWAVGPIGEGRYSERVGIGLEHSAEGSFTPLLAQVEEIVRQGRGDTSGLALLAAFAEFGRRRVLRQKKS